MFEQQEGFPVLAILLPLNATLLWLIRSLLCWELCDATKLYELTDNSGNGVCYDSYSLTKVMKM